MIDKDVLFKPRLTERDVDIPGVGTVRVRGLSRKETIALQACGGDADAVERQMLCYALVDPELTADEVDRWRAAATPGELEPVTDMIAELSGLGDMAAKAAAKSFRVGPGDEPRVPPGPGTEDDGR